MTAQKAKRFAISSISNIQLYKHALLEHAIYWSIEKGAVQIAVLLGGLEIWIKVFVLSLSYCLMCD